MRLIHPKPVDALDTDDLIDLYAPPPEAKGAWTRANMVSSADGAATLDGLSGGLSGGADKRVFKILRMRCDVLVAGAGTVRSEGYAGLRLDEERRRWRTANGMAEHPVMAIVTRSGALDPAAPIFTEAPVRPIVLTCAAAPDSAIDPLREVSDVIVTGESDVEMGAAVDALAARGLRQVLCEGGPHTLAALIAEDRLDELCLTVSPLLAGPGAPRIVAGVSSPPRGLDLRHVIHADGNLILRYARLR
ncbi:pyrimidine reductase family protein [Stackebrandtia soli]|uniref:pyrimidine reductase family protein n=1 Tax=Stackebrandtia soli TaxID=1892856 RepID=UPI0039E7E3C0